MNKLLHKARSFVIQTQPFVSRKLYFDCWLKILVG